MKVAIAGGHGKIALRLAKLLTARGDFARALIRNPAHADEVRSAGAEPGLCDLELDHDLAAAITGMDAVVFAAGAGPGSGPERKMTVDRDGAIKLAHACQRAGVGRYVMISAMGADRPPDGDDTFAVYLRAKSEADRALAASRLDYTIIRPGGLTDDPGTGRILIPNRTQRGQVPRDDVAHTTAAVLETPATVGRTFNLISGATPIPDALAALATVSPPTTDELRGREQSEGS